MEYLLPIWGLIKGESVLKRAGFTLMEVLLASTMVGIVALSVGAIYFASQRFLVQSVNIASAQGDAHYAIEHMRGNVMVANRIVQWVGPGNSSTLFAFRVNNQWFGYRLDGTRLNFISAPALVPSTDTNGDGFIDANDDPTQGDLAGAAAEVPPITQDILAGPNPPFSFLTPSSVVRVDLTVRKTGGGDTRNHTVSTIIGCRGCP